MQKTLSAIGYHGTIKSRAEEILQTQFKSSQRPGLWLGYGRYFFQDAPIHAFRWARHLAVTNTGNPADAAVLWAQIDLSECIDLTDRQYWAEIRQIWELHVRDSNAKQLGVDEIFRRMELSEDDRAKMTREERDRIGEHEVDCSVMNIFIQRLKEAARRNGIDFTTVRAAFIEGGPVYDASWLWNRSAVLISVIEPRAMGPLSLLTDEEMTQLSGA